jgi:hypothetical protein
MSTTPQSTIFKNKKLNALFIHKICEVLAGSLTLLILLVESVSPWLAF